MINPEMYGVPKHLLDVDKKYYLNDGYPWYSITPGKKPAYSKIELDKIKKRREKKKVAKLSRKINRGKK